MRDTMTGPDDEINVAANCPLELGAVDLGDDETTTDPVDEPETLLDDGSEESDYE
jgi:hypothetical protein